MYTFFNPGVGHDAGTRTPHTRIKAARPNNAYLHYSILPLSHEVVETCGVSPLMANDTINAYLHYSILPSSHEVVETCGVSPLVVSGILLPNFAQESQQTASPDAYLSWNFDCLRKAWMCHQLTLESALLGSGVSVTTARSSA
jgi:hypothetical protein